MTTALYALYDPREPEHYRYIGISFDPDHRFIDGHLVDALKGPRSYKVNWLRLVVEEDCAPAMKVLAILEDDEANRIEQLYIASCRRAGMSLTNGTEGGDRNIPTADVRKRLQESMKARWALHPSAEAREKKFKALIERDRLKEERRRNGEFFVRQPRPCKLDAQQLLQRKKKRLETERRMFFVETGIRTWPEESSCNS